MYSPEERQAAVNLYIKYGKSAADAVRELGYPSKSTLKAWYRDSIQEQSGSSGSDKRGSMAQRHYSTEQKKAAVDHYLEHGRSLSRTARAMGYPTRQGLSAWIDELAPGKRKITYGKTKQGRVEFSYEQKKDAVLDLCFRSGTAKEVARAHGTTHKQLYNWKAALIGKGDAMSTDDDLDYDGLYDRYRGLVEAVDDLEEKAARLRLEVDILQETAKLVKKDPSVDQKTLTNREKTILIGALKAKYPLKTLLSILGIAKSSYFYQVEALKVVDKYAEVRGRVIVLFHENEGKYGYRPIHALLKKEKTKISEKIVCSIMREEHLRVRRKSNKTYTSYVGEVTPAPENIVARNFCADNPNEKWLTDITEFAIPAGKVYLSPIVDCFDGMAVSWTIGTSPNAEMANSMLRNAISTLDEDEKPLIHSDRGGHYRWPEWIRLMEEAGLTRSMSKKGCSPDNSACEGFFGRLKLEFFYGRDWKGVSIAEFIDMLDAHLRWYNEVRIKKSLGWMSPMEYRKSLSEAA